MPVRIFNDNNTAGFHMTNRCNDAFAPVITVDDNSIEVICRPRMNRIDILVLRRESP